VNDVSAWEKVAAVATAVGGTGAMLGAIAAWRAARSSGRASRDARDALAATVKPQVQLFLSQWGGPHSPVEARAVVVGALSPAGLTGVAPARDVVLEYNLATGARGSTSTAVLEPNRSHYAGDVPYLNIVIAEPGDAWPPEHGDPVRVTVAYSDTQKLARYQQAQSANLHRAADEGLVSFRDLTESPETRIAP
jgi:hypothetical protein